MTKKVKWFTRGRPLLDSLNISALSERKSVHKNIDASRLTLSLLTFSNFDFCIQLLNSICPMLSAQRTSFGLRATVVVRNNNPALDSTPFDENWDKLRKAHPDIQFMLFNNGYNVGFGRGHNLNFDASPCDYFLVLNDDIGVPQIAWLEQAIAILEQDAKIAMVGASQNPDSVTPMFGNGVLSNEGRHWPLRYAEGSILLARASTFAEIGKFDDSFEWAMFEDADLSFRAQAHGYQIAWIDIPHEHWRSSSFNILPSETKSSLMERNRSVFFSKWNVAMEESHIGRHEIFDLWSDGIGDVFCGLLHLRVFTDTLTDQQRSLVVVNTSALDLAKALFNDQIKVESFKSLDELRTRYAAAGGIHALKSLRDINYSQPFNIHALICSTLGIPVASQHKIGEVLKIAFGGFDSHIPGGAYCVLHLESQRSGHDGRSPSALTIQQIASVTLAHFSHVVLIGKQKILSVTDFSLSKGKITDLQGRLSVNEMTAVVAGGDAFVGIDSFPAHVAQAAGIRSAILFGSVHPSFRVLSEYLTWPIVKPLNCIGCYHMELEPNVPFCMRRDITCMKDLASAVVESAIAGCANLDAYDWQSLATQALELQRKFFSTVLFHPAPEKRFFSNRSLSNQLASNFVYRVLDEVQKILVQGNATGPMVKVERELEELKLESFRKDQRIESMVKLISQLRQG